MKHLRAQKLKFSLSMEQRGPIQSTGCVASRRDGDGRGRARWSAEGAVVKAHSARWLDESTAREKRGSGPCCSDVVGGGSAEEGNPAAVRPVKAIAGSQQ